MEISVVIPCYNESKRIENTLTTINDFLKNHSQIKNHEIICIDDGSKDNTRSIIESFSNIKLNKKRENKGKGFSVKEGMLLAKNEYLLFTDADLSTPIQELDKFLPYSKENDVLIASRNLKESKVERSLWRILVGKSFVLLNNIILGLNIKDTQCGFKMFKKNAAKEIFPLQTINGFAFDVEILFIAEKKGYKIKEIPVNWTASSESTVRVVRDSLKMLKDTIRVRINSIRGVYDKK